MDTHIHTHKKKRKEKDQEITLRGKWVCAVIGGILGLSRRHVRLTDGVDGERVVERHPELINQSRARRRGARTHTVLSRLSPTVSGVNRKRAETWAAHVRRGFGKMSESGGGAVEITAQLVALPPCVRSQRREA